MSKKNYYLKKDKKTGEVIYLEYDKIKGYNITPKSNIYDAITVNKIVFVNPSLSEKIIKKKISIKLKNLLKYLEDIDNSGSTDEDGVRQSLMDAERLKLMILNEYRKYLGNTYQSLTLKKIQIIINQLRIKLYNIINDKRRTILDDLYYLEEDEYRGRKR